MWSNRNRGWKPSHSSQYVRKHGPAVGEPDSPERGSPAMSIIAIFLLHLLKLAVADAGVHVLQKADVRTSVEIKNIVPSVAGSCPWNQSVSACLAGCNEVRVCSFDADNRHLVDLAKKRVVLYTIMPVFASGRCANDVTRLEVEKNDFHELVDVEWC
jgi:hypothetical protein